MSVVFVLRINSLLSISWLNDMVMLYYSGETKKYLLYVLLFNRNSECGLLAIGICDVYILHMLQIEEMSVFPEKQLSND